ncbi:MAG: sodium:calcium antiporter [Firmicutes bacterium]|nr:sodium:calcium antiporter [Bacillota bacterium]
MINHWVQFLVCAAIIVFAGTKLTKSAAVVGDNTGIGSAWVGALMLPLATSMPELVTTIRAVMIDAPDLALGNILGSCLYNLSLLAVIDLVEGHGPLTSRINKGHTIVASLSIITICLAAMAVTGFFTAALGWIGLETLFIVLVYTLGSRYIFRYEQKNAQQLSGKTEALAEGIEQSTTRKALLNFALASVLIVFAGVFLTDAADRVALVTGLGQTFVGSILLAISTSLPETVTTITAVRLGYLDMAVANIFGANFMNLFIIALADLFYFKGPLLQAVSDQHLLSAVMVIMMSTIVIFGLTYKSKKRVAGIGFDTMLVLIAYLATVYLLFNARGN